MARKVVEWYKPSIGIPNWNVKEMSKEERHKLRDRLVMGIVHTEEEYQTVIGYMYKKYPHLMDISGKVINPFTNEIIDNNTSIQWNYTPYKRKVSVLNNKDNTTENNKFDMYAFIYYDKERNYEPICFAGSYFKNGSIDCKDIMYNNELNEYNLDMNSSVKTALGEGYVLFVDPYYRRLGLGSYSWIAESHLYRDIANTKEINNEKNNMIIPLQAEIQNEYSVQSTLNCFPPTKLYPEVNQEEYSKDSVNQFIFGSHSKHLYITSNGRVKNDRSRCQIRLLMNYNDKDLINSFNSMPNNLKEIYNKPHWEFLEREAKNNNMTVEEYNKELIKPWDK